MDLLRAGRTKPQDVVMFYVDEASLRAMDERGVGWPWPRELYASAMEFCRKGGAKAVLFDLFYSEDSVYGVDDDLSFATGVAKGPPSYFVLFLSKADPKPEPRASQILKKSEVTFAGPKPQWMPIERSLASLPIDVLIGAATGFGNAKADPDADGVYRRINLVEALGEDIIPSFALKATSDIKGKPALSWGKRSEFKFGSETIPLDDDGRMMINYYGGADTFINYSLSDVLASAAALNSNQKPAIDPSVVKDKVVIIGLAAPGLYDLKSTPISRVYPGTEIHATVIQNILNSDFIRVVHGPWVFAITLICGIVVSLGLSWISSSMGMGVWLASFFSVLFSASFIMFWRGIWMPIIPPVAALALSSFSMVFRNYMTEGRKKREIRRAFGQYLSPHVVGQIAKDPESLVLGGKEQEITLFFSDIADFTSISEKVSPEDLVGRLNRYFSDTTRIIQESGGTLDKYIGDAIMAFWGAPLSVADHAERAARTALEIQKVLSGGSEFKTRIGIHTGPAVVGNIGSNIRFNYTAIGDTVNLASRLEGLNKQFGTRIILSEATFMQCNGAIEARRIGRVRVKGRDEPIGIYEPLGAKGDFGRLGATASATFSKAMSLFDTAKFPEAAAAFSRLVSEYGDAVSENYHKVCMEYAKRTPEDFDGVITFKSK